MVVDIYNIPWLIWIQMFVFFLLLLLLCILGIFSSDISVNSCSSYDSCVPSTSDSSISRRFLSGDPIPISHHGLGFSFNSSIVQSNQIGSSQAIKGEIMPAATRRTREEEECSSEKDSWSHHPCNFFQRAFLKCFGLDRSNEETEEDSLRTEPKKRR